MRIILVRHGETIWNRERKIQGLTDVGLNDLGIEQAKRLGHALQNEKIDAIVTSPLKRAYETARIIGTYHNLPIQTDGRLREIDAGALEGLTFEELMAEHPGFFGRWMLDNATAAIPHGGESLTQVQERVWPVIREIGEDSKNAIVVAHNFVIITILCKIQNLSLSRTKKVQVDVASKTHIDFNDGVGNVVLFNDTTHLKD